MSKMRIAVAATVLVLALGGCSGGATQTGGGSAGSPSGGPSATQAAQAVTAATVTDIVSQGWLAGNATPTIPAGTQGKTDVVASGPIQPGPGGTSVAVAIRNSTSDAITHVEVTAAAKDAGGKIIASGSSQGFSPATVPAGGLTFGYVYFAPGTTLTADAKLTFTVASQPVKGKPYDRDLKVDQASASGTNIVGQATNTSKDTLKGPYAVNLVCFDEKGALLSTRRSFADPSADLAASQSVTFQVGLYNHPCPSFLVGVSGYGPL